MTRRTATSIAAVALLVSVALDAATIVLGLERGSSLKGVPPVHVVDAVNDASFALLGVLGVLVAWYRPRNVVWLLGTITSVCAAVSNFTFEYVILAKLRVSTPLPAVGLATTLALAAWSPQIFTAPLVMLVYPTGRLLSKRWRWVAGVILGVTIFTTLVFAVEPGQVFGPGSIFANPIGIPALTGLATFVSGALFVPVIALGATGLAALILRYRAAAGDERQQIKWVAYAAGIYAVQVVATTVIYASGQHSLDGLAAGLNVVSVVAFPVAVGIGILRYRLFDIDVVINKTLVYGTLAALVTGFYVAVVIGIGSLVGARSNLPLAIAATAIIAIVFQPLRQRLQLLANRLVFGSRATPYDVLAQFSRQVGDVYAGEDVLQRMARVLAEGTDAGRAEVWVGDRLAAAYGEGAGGEERSVPVAHQGEVLGRLSVVKRRGEGLTQHEEKLLADLAAQAGLVVRNVSLNQQLLQRLEELRASRERLVRAQDDERRRLERDLHDGAQQQLVALKLQLGLARDADPAQLAEIVDSLEADADAALKTMRELARGIYPPLLADAGLRAALEAHARRATLPVTVEAGDVGRYPQDVEAAVYFCVLEALQNVQKHAGASHARVRLLDSDGLLRFEVADDGRGFEPGTAAAGAGLTNLRDRLEALGGDLELISAPGQGTTIAGAVPLQRSSDSSSSSRSKPSRTPVSMPEASIASRSAGD